MNHLLKSSKIKQSMQAENDSAAEDAREQESLDQIRASVIELKTAVQNDMSRDERILSLEKLLIRMYDALEKSEQNRIAEEEKEASDEELECARLEAELKASELECEQVEKKLESAHGTLLAETQRCGNLSAELARCEAMCEAETRARTVAETALVQAKAEHERHMQMMMTMMAKPEGDDTPAPLGWNMDVQRDGADKIMRLVLIPKE